MTAQGEIRELEADEVELISGGVAVWIHGPNGWFLMETDFDREG